ncbi:MAG: (2Fe-2S) ferredoxin domain-containing protein [Gammaproteobacteria bacterium]|nr:(2Fe-2S) ferredoxin domain-containing protein [Gammaproteobacteria bacterium]MDH5727976.1 (2Fe-2S) ferredoxin domain-containing protein [Gammaproteobacteria bacterium]
MAENYYQHHVFMCENKRSDGASCCEDNNASAIRAYAKQQLKDKGLWGKGKIRFNSAGCLARCAQGPVMVIYPEETWYSYIDEQDIDEIISEHLLGGKVVERLLILDN